MKLFSELSLKPQIMQSITDMGFKEPTPIQAQALPILLGKPTDFLGVAATGTGKTVAFGIPLLERVNPSLRAVQGLILCPTRELALQVCGQINLIGKHLGLKAIAIYGGAPYPEQIMGLRRGATIVVGTPGRVTDHMDRRTLDLSKIQTLVLDEADEMISMGFKDELEKVLNSAPKEGSNIWLFSATMGREVKTFADKYLKKPEQVRVNQTEVVPDRIEQIYYRTHEDDKPEIICKLIDAADDFYGIIFCQTKALVVDLTEYLNARGYGASCLHGDMDQSARERTLRGYRNRQSKVLVCTDVASRGLDVKDITHVINYSLPRELENYVHRIGRTARSGKTGVAMSLVTPSHRALVRKIEQITKSTMHEGKLPTRREIGAKKVTAVLPKFLNQPQFGKAIELLGEEWKKAIREMKPEEIVARFVTLTFPDVFSEQKEPKQEQRQDSREGPGRREFRPRPPGAGKPSFRSNDGRSRGPWQHRDRGGDRPSAHSGNRPAGRPSNRPAIRPQANRERY